MEMRPTFILSIVVAVVATALLIYLTPLRHVALVPASMHEMDPKEFHEDFKANPDDYLLVDVRSPSIYTSAHAEGAINIPIENLYDDKDSLPRSGKKIALICTTGRLAAIGYGYLESQGFTNLIHIEGGMVNWVVEGLPVEGKNVELAASTTMPDEHQ
jgi:rhodanese-related sulfurtransferase